jgi:hypothetical protein
MDLNSMKSSKMRKIKRGKLKSKMLENQLFPCKSNPLKYHSDMPWFDYESCWLECIYWLLFWLI